MTRYSTFKNLHYQATPLLIGNVWNVQSASIFERLNFKAIGTSSAAIANTLGYHDGQQVPFAELLFIVDRITKTTALPLTVDLEFGYGTTAQQIADNIAALSKKGVVGINLEDSTIGNGTRKLSNSFAGLLAETILYLKQLQVEIFINLRCDAYLLQLENALDIAKERIALYEQAGVDGIFIPCLTSELDIKEIVSCTQLPVNVMCMPTLPDFTTLQDLGVKRISMGNFLNENIYTSLERISQHVLASKSFNCLF
ncbi:isocitrate lyase/phosphoenolpyruvate mutase family protein [Pontibacter sp. H259]|uniref:isocitrate lyase/PEP mutase family protein n=1 Tax=Pontibacter sp. H259 TaxID=3133421 RepID=UPI0030BA3723